MDYKDPLKGFYKQKTTYMTSKNKSLKNKTVSVKESPSEEQISKVFEL